MYSKLFIVLLLSGLVLSCGTVQKSKEFVKDNNPLKENPLKEASRKQALSDAREDVLISKKEYQKCMEKNDQDVYKCVPEREKYERATDTYIEVQKQ
ncbi:MAG: hypothetical protein ACRENO_09245 [Thermodesulfobacteriota bacterium]